MGWQPSEREWCWIASVSEGVVWVLLDKREKETEGEGRLTNKGVGELLLNRCDLRLPYLFV